MSLPWLRGVLTHVPSQVSIWQLNQHLGAGSLEAAITLDPVNLQKLRHPPGIVTPCQLVVSDCASPLMIHNFCMQH
jgi:hypothetical protein